MSSWTGLGGLAAATGHPVRGRDDPCSEARNLALDPTDHQHRDALLVVVTPLLPLEVWETAWAEG